MRYYLRQGGKIDGPWDASHIRELIAAGKARTAKAVQDRGQTLSELEGSTDWVNVSTVLDQMPGGLEGNFITGSASLDARVPFGVLGLLAGATIGFLTRPSAFLVGQLPLATVISRGSNLSGMDQLLVPAAQASFNQMLLVGIVGAVIGVGIAWARTRSKHSFVAARSGELAAPLMTIPAGAETLDNESITAMVAAGLSDDLILEKMKYSHCAFAVASSALAELKQRGVSDRVLAVMLQKENRVTSA